MPFTSQTLSAGNPTVYYSFLLNVQQNPSGTKQILALSSSSSSLASPMTVFLDSSGKLALGKNSSTAASVTAASALSAGTHLIVVRYSWVTGTANDVYSLWVDPSSLGVVEGSVPAATISTASGSDFSAVASIAVVHQTTPAPPGSFFVDELRVGLTWASVTPLGGTPTTTTIETSLTPQTYGSSVTFTSTVSPAAATGTVAFKAGGTNLGTGTLSSGVATYTTSGTQLPVGSHSVTAVYAGDGTYSGSTSSALTQTINPGASTKLVYTTSVQNFPAGGISGTITVQRQDAYNNPNTAEANLTVNLSSTSGTGVFRDNGDTTDITSVTITSGSSSASFRYKDTTPGTPTLTAAESPDSGLTDAAQSANVAAPQIWSGNNGNNDWDTLTANWDGGTTTFAGGNNVVFDNTGYDGADVNLVGTLSPGSVTVSASTKNYTFSTTGSGKLSGSMSLTKNSASTLTLSTANDYTGTTSVNAGTVKAANAAALSTTAISIGGSGTLEVTGVTLNQPVNLASGATLRGSGGTQATPTASNGKMTLAAGATATFNTVAASDFFQTGNGASDVDGGTGGAILNLAGPGVISIGTGGAMAYSGDVRVTGGIVLSESVSSFAANTVRVDTGGTLAHSSSTALQATTPLILNGGTLGAEGGDRSYAGAVTLQSSSSVDLRDALVPATARSVTLSAAVSGSGGLTVGGLGTLTLSSANTYSGGTLINSGTVSIANKDSLGTGLLTLAGGTLSASASLDAVTNDITLTADSTISGGNVAPRYNGILSGSAGTLTFSGTAATFAPRLQGAFTFNRPVVLANANTSLRFYNASGTQTFTGIISGSGNIHRRSANAGVAGETIFNAANTFSGGATISDGAIGFGIDSTGPAGALTDGPIGTGTLLQVEANVNLLANTILFASGGARSVGNALILTNTEPLIIAGANDLTLYGNVTLSPLGITTIQTDNTGNTILSGVLSAGSLSKMGAGVLTLSGVNTYGGNTTIGNGTLALSGTGSIGSSPSINVVSGATLDVSAGSFTLGASQTLAGSGSVIGAVTINGTVAPGASIGTLTFSTPPTLSGAISIEIDRTNAQTADKIIGAGALGGTLTVVNIGPSLVNGDTFDLFDGTLTGTFATVNLPLGGALHWNTSDLYVGGTVTFNNVLPAAADFGVGVPVGGSVTAVVMGKFATSPDADGDTVTITSVSTPANGTATIVGGTNITYANTSAAASDSFTYTVSDGVGGTVTKTVTVTISSPEGFNKLSGPTPTGNPGEYALDYLGIPGQQYALDETSSLTPPITWTPLWTNTAAGNGALSFTVTPANPAGFFRTRSVP